MCLNCSASTPPTAAMVISRNCPSKIGDAGRGSIGAGHGEVQVALGGRARENEKSP
jgi:hypothetical protein